MPKPPIEDNARSTGTALARPAALGLLVFALSASTPAAAADRSLGFAEPVVEDPDIAQLHSYAELVDRLHQIAAASRGRIRVGPLINRVNLEGGADNGGLLPVSASLVQAVLDTVPVRRADNVPANFGKSSTLVRELMAARVGNPHGRRVLMITQQHGNEPFSTEAVLDLLEALGGGGPIPRLIRREIDLLVIVRANPDGGEPDLENCLRPDAVPGLSAAVPMLLGLVTPPLAMDGAPDCAFYRFNIDPTAGTTTVPGVPLVRNLVDGNLFGVIGYGYDLNRYHFYDLDKPIPPMETQAMVAAVRHFDPDILVDLHHKNSQARCPQDSLEAGPFSLAAFLLGFQSLACSDPEGDEVVTATVDLGRPVATDPAGIERLGAAVLGTLNLGVSKATRFNQQSSALGPGLAHLGAGQFGIPALVVDVFGTRDIVLTPDVKADSTEPFGLSLSGWPGYTHDGFRARLATRLHRRAMYATLIAIARGLVDAGAPGDDGGFNTNPAWVAPNLDYIVPRAQVREVLKELLPEDQQPLLDLDPPAIFVEIR